MFDIFDHDGNLVELGDYTAKMEYVPIAHKDNYIYGYKWPVVEVEQFEAYGNPEIVVYRVDVDHIFQKR